MVSRIFDTNFEYPTPERLACVERYKMLVQRAIRYVT